MTAQEAIDRIKYCIDNDYIKADDEMIISDRKKNYAVISIALPKVIIDINKIEIEKDVVVLFTEQFKK